MGKSTIQQVAMALAATALASMTDNATPYYPKGRAPRDRSDDHHGHRTDGPTGPSRAELEYQATAAAIRAERLKRKAENFAKRQPKAKPT